MKNENPALMRHGSGVLDHGPSGMALPEHLFQDRDGGARAEIAAPGPMVNRHGPIVRLVRRLLRALSRRRTSRALMRLSDEGLKDIGLARCQVYGDIEFYRRSQSHAIERRCGPPR